MLSELLECLRLLYRQWGTYLDSCVHGYTTHGNTGSSFRAPLAYTGNVGRPRFHVTQHQLQYLRSMSFSWVQIAHILSISTMTLYRRRVEFNMVREPSGVLTDSELHFVVLRLQSEMPALGQTMVWGQLRSMGFSVTRERVRNTLREIDPIETALRWRGQVVHRQPYSVPGPNSLWHLGKGDKDECIANISAHYVPYRWTPQIDQVGDGNPLCNRWVQSTNCLHSVLDQ